MRALARYKVCIEVLESFVKCLLLLLCRMMLQGYLLIQFDTFPLRLCKV